MSHVCREYDYAARMGGDEFVIVAPNMTESAVAERTRVLNQLARQAGHDVCRTDLLSLSAGVAFYPRDGSNAEQLLAEADRKMYAAKHDHYAAASSTEDLTAGKVIAG